MYSGVSYVTQLEGGVGTQLLLHRRVPLPRIRSYAAGVLGVIGRNRGTGDRRWSVQRPIGIDADDEGSRTGHSLVDAHQFTLVKLACAETEGRFTISEDVPRDTDARCNVVIGLVDKRAVRPGRARG
jgi:hypothetical protein